MAFRLRFRDALRDNRAHGKRGAFGQFAGLAFCQLVVVFFVMCLFRRGERPVRVIIHIEVWQRLVVIKQPSREFRMVDCVVVRRTLDRNTRSARSEPRSEPRSESARA